MRWNDALLVFSVLILFIGVTLIIDGYILVTRTILPGIVSTVVGLVLIIIWNQKYSQ